jgi:flagellin-like protein
MKTFRRSKKALSPVVASIILIAVTVAVSIAVAAWMGALSVGFMQTEQLSITSVRFLDDVDGKTINVTLSNTGTTAVKIDQVWVNAAQKDLATEVAYSDAFVDPPTLPGNAKGASIQITETWNSGDTYQVKLVSAKGTSFLYTAVAA